MCSDKPVVELNDLQFRWRAERVPVLSIPHMSLAPAERVFIRGASGSGKSTLLGLVAGINLASSGSVQVLGKSLASLSASRRDAFRADHIGVIFQQFNLLPYLSVLENVLLSCRFSRHRCERFASHAEAVDEAHRLLRQLDIDTAVFDQRSTDLSVGQQQRVAAARALMGRPELVIADEPTSSLDAERRQGFIELLFQECREEGAALMFVSHDASLEPLFDRSLHLDQLNQAS
jgi:putative ABC transport system ATP-binding protein